jgi:hypothetical protein
MGVSRPALLLVSLLLLAAAGAESPAWDAERVTALAAQLDAAVQGLLADPGLASRQPDSLQQRRHHAAIVGVREFGRMATDLHRQLQSGRSRSQTEPLWRQMLMLRDEVRFYAEASWLPADTRARADAVGQRIRELDRYYAGD